MVEANADIDMAKLAKLAELVSPGGGKEIAALVATARAGIRIEF
jgi:hypothetical protein